MVLYIITVSLFIKVVYSEVENMPIVLPRQATKAQDKDPAILVMLASTKCGKTSSCLQLPNSLLIDLEDGSRYYDGVTLNLKQESLKTGKGVGGLLLETANAIREANQQNGSPFYDFITIDTLTVIEQLAAQKATIDYKATIQGKNFTGRDVCRELPKGAGYGYLTAAFNDLINPFKGLAGKCLILLAHKKLKTVEKDSGAEFEINDIELIGKNKLIITSQADSIGYLYRDKKNTNQNIICFRKDEGDTIWGSRSPHLQNKSFVFSTYNKETGELKTNWDLIFTSLSKGKTNMQEVEDEEITPVVTTNGKKPEPIPS
jgi:hypothetical protein